MSYGISIIVDGGYEARASATVARLQSKLSDEDGLEHKPMEQRPGTWTFAFDGERGTQRIERLLGEVDAGWNRNLRVVLSDRP